MTKIPNETLAWRQRLGHLSFGFGMFDFDTRQIAWRSCGASDFGSSRVSVFACSGYLPAGAVHVSAAEPWRFIITCDSRGSLATGVNDPILAEMVQETLRWNAEFLVFAGDLVYGAGIPPDQFETQLWNWVKVVRPLYDAGVGVYVCRGNHEVGDMWRAEPNEPPDPKDNYALRWLNVFGSDQHPELKLPDNGPAGEKYMSYAVAHKNVLVVALDQYAGMGHHAVHSVNQAWLDAQLRANTKPHVFAFGHEPAFRTFHSDCLDAYPDRRDALWRSLASAGARAYTCGHDHYYDHARIDDGDGNPNNDIHQLDRRHRRGPVLFLDASLRRGQRRFLPGAALPCRTALGLRGGGNRRSECHDHLDGAAEQHLRRRPASTRRNTSGPTPRPAARSSSPRT